MHERTERALCRLAFLILCALPTLVTIAATMVTRTDWYYRGEIAAIEQSMAQRLGVVVEIGEMQRPTPGTWRFSRVVLKDPETGNEVARVRHLSYAVLKERAYIHLSQPELQSGQLGLLWRIAHERFLCQPDLVGRGLDLVADDLSVHSRIQGLTLSPVRIWVEPRESATTAIARFTLAGRTEHEEPATLSVTRTRGDDRLRTRWELITGSSPLPCVVLGDYLPAMRQLGVDADFTGILRWEMDRDDYTVQLQGARFRNVNMSTLMEPLDHRISGMGTVEILGLTRHSGRPISQASGSLVVRDCKLDNSLLRSVLASFPAASAPLPDAPEQRLDCQLLAVHFELYGAEMQLTGICSDQPNFESMHPGTAVVVGNRPLIHLDPRGRIEANALTAALDPRGRASLPLGSDRQWVRDLLPRVAPPSDAPSAPVVRGVRMRDADDAAAGR